MRRVCPECYEQVEVETLADNGSQCPKCGQLFTVMPGSASPNDETVAALAPALPERFGRYRVLTVLGSGGFGIVYKGYDEELRRDVAIKVPKRERVASQDAVDAYLAEARHLASLDHPGIVSAYDVGRTEDGLCYVVSKFVEGCDLKRRMRQGSVGIEQAVEIVASVAEALHHAHARRLVHGDIKPANILLDRTGKAYVADFGLARRDEELDRRYRFAGTLPYMSPEQVRGESHRVDPRSDVYSLGVVFYELLTARRPFEGDVSEELADQILTVEPRPPRQFNAAIARELDRICLKCVAKRASDRYSTALDLSEDLRHWQQGRVEPTAIAAGATALPPGTTAAASAASSQAGSVDTERRLLRVLPKGLRSFEAVDKDFFLDLLPGPRDREGLPGSIRFWKTRLEQTDPDETFSVGLLYGPSGSGKSSLLKAGLIPRLADHVIPVYVEATPDETEERLLKNLRKQCLGLPDNLGLVDSFSRLRRGRGLPQGKKLLIVLDQFEQWLHAKREQHGTELVQALRQCDGEHLQAVILVRDDFWLAVSRFLGELEVPLLEGHNAALVDLFDLPHARKVLSLFGRAYECLPEYPTRLTSDQDRFLDDAVTGLAEGGKVICVRLSLFAEMVKGKPWTASTLRSVGGAAGIAVTFLEETFGAALAPLAHRVHQQAARAVLQTLLPEPGTNLKGARRSRRELLDASGYATQPKQFNDLLQILDNELRLVTPADLEELNQPAGPSSNTEPNEDAAASSGDVEKTRFFQLTHDYLVPGLREWLTRKQRETWRGRAQLKLDEHASEWSRTHQNRFLPTAREFAAMLLGVPRDKRTPSQRKLLHAATRYHGLRWGAGLAVLIILAAALQQFLAASRVRHAEARVDALVGAVPDAVPLAIESLMPLRSEALPALRRWVHDQAGEPSQRLHAACALAAFGEPDAKFVIDSIPLVPASVGECRNIVAALRLVKEPAAALTFARFEAESDVAKRSRFASTLLGLGDPRASQRVLALARDPAGRTSFIHEFASWHGDLSVAAELAEQHLDPAFRSGLCAAWGTLDPQRLPAQERQRVRDALQTLFLHTPDGGTHSAAGWALRQWRVELPAIELTPQPPAGRGWFVNRQQMTMLKISPGTFLMGDSSNANSQNPLREVTITRPFYMCDREVWVDLFQQFIDDPNCPDEIKAPPADDQRPEPSISPTGECPMQKVSWTEMLLFCNWLSVKEGREPCYATTGETRTTMLDSGGGQRRPVEWQVWSCRFDGDGYRLPTEAEWEYACRAGSATRYHFGGDQSLVPRYAVTSNRRWIPTLPGRSLLPNAWGLFDVHGNVWEQCWDWNGPYPESGAKDPRGPEEPLARYGVQRMSRGGGVANTSGDPDSAARGPMPPGNTRFMNSGLRVVCGESPVAEKLKSRQAQNTDHNHE